MYHYRIYYKRSQVENTPLCSRRSQTRVVREVRIAEGQGTLVWYCTVELFGQIQFTTILVNHVCASIYPQSSVMSLLDRVPGELPLYIGGLFTLRRKEQLEKANITHILSVLRYSADSELFKGYKHMLVEVDDVEDENLLEHFTTTNGFIQEGLDSGGGVLVHW